ncbi:hypothetical protein [Nocardia bovistercoris]|uniref:Uncharacterized protein n=1 Tax=Nocardia bovistercoris TaxID=2785916 RepID=A0A931IHT1_9NOCA|nr:hypothetical protein [Nocardia bovistercoris]MBH0780838.1 hypothetical protein [Nocardia bovistercoris]
MLLLGIAVVALLLTGCGTQSPPEQGDRERVAAGIPLLVLRLPGDLWARTSTGAGHKPIEEPRRLTETPEGGLTVELTGAQLVDYLRLLDFNAHGGFMARDKETASKIYREIAVVLDNLVTPRAADAPPPEVTIDGSGSTNDAGPPS